MTRARLKPYPETRDTGIEWFGSVPSHWRCEKLKYNSHIKGRIGWQNLRSHEFTEEGPYLVTGMHFSGDSVDWDACYHITPDRYAMAPEIQLKAEDVVVTKDGTIGKVAYIRELPGPASLNSHLLVIRSLRGDYWGRYLFYTLVSDAFTRFAAEEQKGTTFFGITQASVESFPMPLPPLDEQQAIAGFLDRETAKIDALVAKKEELIELLQEKRTALITHAVTKGLDPDVSMKGSAIEWLGQIPAHWDERAFKHLFRIIYRYPTYYGIEYVDDGVPEVRGEALVDGSIVKLQDQRYISAQTNTSYPLTILDEGDLVMSVRGTMGKIGVVSADFVGGNITANLLRLAPERGRVDSQFVAWLLRSSWFLRVLEKISPQTTIRTITMPQLSAILLPIPQIAEQQAIADHLDRETATIDALIAKVQEAIERLKEYRTALISAAVTGKIDVRECIPDAKS